MSEELKKMLIIFQSLPPEDRAILLSNATVLYTKQELDKRKRKDHAQN